MIDKNDVKMPVQKENTEALLNDKERVGKIEDLLDLVNDADNRQELRLNEEYYGRFNWFGTSSDRRDKNYFSYQEEAVYDFIFNLNKSGILSDQVGMGKTIEAGMIISELASRNELRSLLIIVPNEIMAEKWEYELAEKFGIKTCVRELPNGTKQVYPQVKALVNYDDFCKAVYDCISEEKFVEITEHKFTHKYQAGSAKEALADIINSFVKSDINTAVKLINEGFACNDLAGDPAVEFDGKIFRIRGTQFSRAYEYDKSGAIRRYLNGKQNQRPENVINNTYFGRTYNEIIKQELGILFTLIGDYFTTIPEEITNISEIMTNRYPILAIPISYSEQVNGKTVQMEFLNRTLSSNIENYKHKSFVQQKDGRIEDVYEDYRIIDFFIDVGYQTLIVDEVHDYIDVSAKMERKLFHKKTDNTELGIYNSGYSVYPSDIYNRYELFDDYYFIKKSSLYKKLKALADKANRKIFLTATPIKSDMVDFYLLTLLASNKDSEAYKKVSENLENAYPLSEVRENTLADLYNTFRACVENNSARHFCGYKDVFLKHETVKSGDKEENRYEYPYFNNDFLKANVGKADVVRDYLLSHISYMTMEEVVMELVLAYTAESKDGQQSDLGISKIIERLIDLLSRDADNLQTRVVFRCLLNNTVKMRFEEDFTKDKKPIKRIRELLEMEEGPRKWFNTYRKYGIRHTRHQTYNLAKCDSLEKLSKTRVERYKNLPVWPRRNGKVIFLLRDDIFFDSFLKVERGLKRDNDLPVRLSDLPNSDKLSGDDGEKEERLKNATAIYDYINNAMSGGNPSDHRPQSSRYESVDLDDAGMVDYKLALVNKLMLGRDTALGSVSRKVLLFAENDRDAITEWFRYQRCAPLYGGEQLDKKKAEEYKRKWQSYRVEDIAEEWQVSEDTGDLDRTDGNLLVIIDPKRYEKGVDLQKADTIINFDINYDPLKMEQRIGRIDRIRPAGQNPEINIVSFVPLNDMSGFVINFFANEMKMFTQWMGETTGIVSVPDDEKSTDKGEDVSFEGKIYTLEKYYNYVYDLCMKEVSAEDTVKAAKDFSNFFGTDVVKTEYDFSFIQALRKSFDGAFRNSITPQREGYTVIDDDNARIIRFNSSMGVFAPCMSAKCDGCANAAICQNGSSKRNSYKQFYNSVNKFFSEGAAFYKREREIYHSNQGIISSSQELGSSGLAAWLKDREKEFAEKGKTVAGLLPAVTDAPFTMPYEKYEEIFLNLKKLYWDDMVDGYIKLILDRFYKQCDNVLKGASIFERFIKTFSIADFMSNMEGTL